VPFGGLRIADRLKSVTAPRRLGGSTGDEPDGLRCGV